MICDQLALWRRYAALSPWFDAAFAYLEAVTPDLANGRHAVDGDNVFALVQRYLTKPAEQCVFEAHRQYIDVQFVVAGRETILWSPLPALTRVTQPYDAGKDVALFGPVATATPLHLAAGQFAVLFPEDGHAPCAEWNGPTEVMKVVVKVRASSTAPQQA
jgi:YhcH/YjgK/YiaL family protein